MPAAKTKEPEVTEIDEVADILDPPIAEYTFTLGENTENPITFVQKPLGFMGKIKLFSVLSATLRKVMDEDVSISDILDAPDSDSMPISGQPSKESDIFIKSIASVLEYAPEALGDIFCVILAVPASQQEYMKTRFDEDLTDDQAFAVLNTFVDQNWEVLYDFFTGKGLSLFKKITSKFQK